MTTCCTATRPNGDPCRARPLPDRDVCLFHDPGRAALLTEARRTGGAAPRRVRRLPRHMDHLDIAALLGEILIDALNRPDDTDTKRLAVLTRACQLLLKAVGIPKEGHYTHADRGEPSPTADYLLRIYPPIHPEIEALLATEPPDTPPSAEDTAPTSPLPEPPTLQVPPDLPSRPSPHRLHLPAPRPLARVNPPAAAEQDTEQDANRTWTGLSASADSGDPFPLSPVHPLIPVSLHLLDRERHPSRHSFSRAARAAPNGGPTRQETLASRS
jgi:hypothetical protein